MSVQTDFNDLLTAVLKYRLPTYTESKALLYWFLFNVFRLDEIEARDSICDKKNDKGIDGIWVDEDSEEIYLFQAKYTAAAKNTLGDTDLKEFVGSATWFSKSENISKLLASNANAQLKALVVRHVLLERLEKNWPVKLV